MGNSYNDRSPEVWFVFTPHDTNKITYNGKNIFCRAIRASAACTLKVRCQGPRSLPADTGVATTVTDNLMLFAAGETRAVSADMIFATGSTLGGATIEVAY